MINIGELVRSEYFSGIGKVVLINEEIDLAEVSFFESPLSSDSRILKSPIKELSLAKMHDEAVIYCKSSQSTDWKRARYGGSRPSGRHLVIYRSGEQEELDISNIYILNLSDNNTIDAKAFLASRTTDTPFFSTWRSDFIKAYIEQRASCLSISSILNSGVDLEVHQIAVVKKVLQDDVKKYVLADEVGLGKTIEAGMILRELLLSEPDSVAVISVPEALVFQWKKELSERFFLSELYDINLYICSHEELSENLKLYKPTITIIDEVHQISPKAWSENESIQKEYIDIAKGIHNSQSTLLLSGTPLIGNEKNFLAMLHLLTPDAYPLTNQGIIDFHQKVQQREFLGGAYQALFDDNDNSTLTDVIESLLSMFPEDANLQGISSKVIPLIDWIADEDGQERSLAIDAVKTYLGENYRLHQRLLRNRREDPNISVLFPGLIGSESLYWDIDEYSLSIEQRLNAFKDEFITTGQHTNLITIENFWEWIEAALVSPSYLKRKALSVLDKTMNVATGFEFDEIKQLIAISDEEQNKKDAAFFEYVSTWLSTNIEGQVVVFCTIPEVADSVYGFLVSQGGFKFERHTTDQEPKFISDKSIKVLICDEAGEDGLNLHGGKKLVIHYSLPLSISRIEQRLGRVNRYSASTFASPIKSVVMMPEGNSFSTYWYNLLDKGVGVFNDSVASLQYVLEDKLKSLPLNFINSGYSALAQLVEEFKGDNGWIDQEKRKVKTQEQLNNMDALVSSAKKFSESLIKADSEAENQTDKMNKWIKDGLRFKRVSGELQNTFRFKYVPSKTLMDISSFISNCILGLDIENSDYKSPLTSLMAYDRTIASKGNKVSPYRYGQPFLNTIFKSLSTDTRGVSSAQIRLVKGVKEPIACFMFEWLNTHLLSNSSKSNQRIYDEIYQPNIKNNWFFEGGKEIQDPNILSLLEKPYEPFDKTSNLQYQDINLRRERWDFIKDNYPELEWYSLVERIYSASLNKLENEDSEDVNQIVERQCISAKVVILVDPSRL